jgi:hypothetical protein
MIRIQMTYEKTTEESASNGENSDHGFAEPGGYEYSIADQSFHDRCEAIGRDAALAEKRPEPGSFDTINEAISFLEDYGPFEPSSSDLNAHTWLTQSDPDRDMHSGEETRLSFHLECDPIVHVLILQKVCSDYWTRNAPKVAHDTCDDCEAIIPGSGTTICQWHEHDCPAYSATIVHEVRNLDGCTIADLKAYQKKLQLDLPKYSGDGSGSNAYRHVLIKYCSRKIKAMQHRLAGRIDLALQNEAQCDDLYSRLPDAWRW